MQRLQPAWVLCAAITSATFMLAAPALAAANKFVFVPQSDSPGNDYLRVEKSSFEDCAQRCDVQSQCNAFTYNQLHSVCFLKLAANRATTFFALAITGVKLSPSVQPIGGAPRGGASFVMLSQANSTGNDYSRIDNFDMEECRHSCEVDDGCNAFTYNLAKGVCFLKRAANQWTNFYAWAITGIKLSSPTPAQVPQPRSPIGAPIEVPLIAEAGTFKVPVLINGAIELHFTVDTGASDVVIPVDVVMTLMRTGTLNESDFLGSKTYVLADGSTVPSETFRIRTLKVGDHVIEDVVGSMGDVRGPLLLGQSFLSKLNYWSIDNSRHVLVLN